MGIVLGSSKSGAVSDPNVVPLIDVLLVLIIIFMVITPKVPIGLPTVIPQPAPPIKPNVPELNPIVVQVQEGGKLMINRDRSDWDALGPRLADIFKERGEKIAFVEGDGEVSFAEVARAIDIMRGAGIEHVGLITAHETTEE
jgi:biopolymer transport protein TolR